MNNKKQPSKKENAVWATIGIVMMFVVCAFALNECGRQEYKAPADAQEQLSN